MFNYNCYNIFISKRYTVSRKGELKLMKYTRKIEYNPANPYILHHAYKIIFISILFILLSGYLFSAATIPAQAWSRDINGSGYIDGAPIGGFGAGTITWQLDGVFYKDRLNIAGVGSGAGTDTITFTNDPTARFFLYQKPTSGGTATMTQLDAATLGSGQANYYSLFPKSWVDYYGSKFTVLPRVTQFSPIIPGDYQRVSYPEGIYYWDLTNPTSQSMDAAIMLTWQNNYSGVSATVVNSGNFTGIVLDWTGTGAPTAANQGQFALGSVNGSGVTVTAMSAAAVSTITSAFSTNGTLANTGGANTIGAVAFKITLAPGQNVRMPIVLAWDIPLAQPGTGYLWWRQYTKYFGQTGRAAWTIAQDALTNCASYESQIDTWQSGILTNAYYPSWLKTMLFNELYVYFTNGTMWEAGGASGQATLAGESMFSHLESYIYEFYGTSDVRFYGSWALFLNWPNIDKQAVEQFSDSIYTTRTDRPAPLGTCAHDFGDPNDIFEKWNDYTYRDSTTWKDLNSKFVLMVYRDYHLTGDSDTTFLNYCYTSVKTAMNKVHSECGADGLPQSSGVDQTYDDMNLTSTTAYCGSLFLAACQAAVKLANAEGDTSAANTYQAWYNTAQPNFISELWTGSYFKIDTGSSAPTRIMSDQLCGEWYSKALGLGGIVTDAQAQSAWQTVYNNNFSLFNGGANGVVNVMTAAGAIDTTSSQTEEAWVGPTWGVVSGMVQEDMTSQANAIGESLFNTIWNTAQFWFRTPEAWQTGVTNIRAYYYMRGSTVWACKQAYDLLPSTCSGGTCTPPPTNTATGTPTATPTINPCGTSIIRDDCGSTVTAQDSQGRTWSADQAFTTGGWGYMEGSNETQVTNTIANTTSQILYQTGHYASDLEYKFTVPKNGPYQVNLMWAEIYWTTTGQRVFNVFIQGQEVLANFDIVKAAGANFTAYNQSFYVNVTDSVIDITTTNITDDPVFSGIEIIDMSTQCTVTTTPTKTSFTMTDTQNPTFTMTVTPSFTVTGTPSRTMTVTPTASPTFTRTGTPTSSQTPTGSSTQTPSPTYTTTPTYTGTSTITATDTIFLSRTPTYTLTTSVTPTFTGTSTATATPSASQTDTGTGTATPTPSDTPSSTQTDTKTVTISPTGTFTNTPIVSPTPTFTNIIFTWTITPTLTISPTNTATSSITPTGTDTCTATPSATPSWTPTDTPTATNTDTGTFTLTATGTRTYTGTPTFTNTVTPTFTATPSFTSSVTGTATLTQTLTFTATVTQTSTNSPVVSPTPTSTNIVLSWTITPTYTVSLTITLTNTPQNTPTWTYTPSFTATATFTGTPTATATCSFTATLSVTLTATPTVSPSSTLTFTATSSITITVTPTFTITVLSATPTPTASLPAVTFTPVPPTCTPTVPENLSKIGPLKPYPNPFNPGINTVLKIALGETIGSADSITLKIYTTAFRLVREKIFIGADAAQIAESGILQYDSSNIRELSAGTYYYIVLAEKGGIKVKSSVDKIIILK